MIVSETTQIPDAALPLAQFRAHLRLGTGFDNDSLQDEVLLAFLRASLAAVEARCGKILLQRDFQWQADSWGAKARLPVAPVSAVALVELVDLTGAATVVAAESYGLVPDLHAPRLVATAGCLPNVPEGGFVRVSLTAGLAEDWDRVPPDLAQAVLLLAAHYYEFRAEQDLHGGCMPFGVTALLERYRPLRVGLEAGA